VAPQILGSILPMGANIPEFISVVFLVVDDVPVDNETPMMTSSISRIFQPSLQKMLIGAWFACLRCECLRYTV
jgi:hypothetical protein